ELLAQAELRDVRAFMKECPSNLTVYDPLLLKVLARKPRDWDVFVAYGLWKLREYVTRQRYRARHGGAPLWSTARKIWHRTASYTNERRRTALCSSSCSGCLEPVRARRLGSVDHCILSE